MRAARNRIQMKRGLLEDEAAKKNITEQNRRYVIKEIGQKLLS